jgi:type I restriction enzyme S subunit
MADYPSVPLVQLIEPTRNISYGIVQPGSAIADGIPIIRVSDVRNGQISTTNPLRVRPELEAQYQRTRLQGGELLLTIVGTIGETAIVPRELAGWNVARAIAVLPVRSDVGAYWVQLVLKSPLVRSQIDSRLNTTVQATLNLGDVAQLPILLPPEPERQNIGAVLSTLDYKIELNRRMNETLETMARELFKDWFVDFGPTRAKMEGGAPYLRSRIWALFPHRLDEQGRPEGWKGGTLGDIAFQVGESVSPETLAPETPYIGLEHMPRRSIALEDWEGAGKVTSGKLAFKRGDFLFGKLRPYFHKVGIAPLDGICSTDIVVLNAKSPETRSFVISCISQDQYVAFTDRTSDGTKMPRTSWGRMEKYEICIPTPQIFEAFDETASPLFERLMANIHESTDSCRHTRPVAPKANDR